MAKDKVVEFEAPETVTVNSRTFFKGKAFVTETDKRLIQREITRLQEERAADEGDGEASDEGTTKYTKTQLNKMDPDELTRIAKDELDLAVEEGATKAALVKQIYDAQ